MAAHCQACGGKEGETTAGSAGASNSQALTLWPLGDGQDEEI